MRRLISLQSSVLRISCLALPLKSLPCTKCQALLHRSSNLALPHKPRAAEGEFFGHRKPLERRAGAGMSLRTRALEQPAAQRARCVAGRPKWIRIMHGVGLVKQIHAGRRAGHGALPGAASLGPGQPGRVEACSMRALGLKRTQLVAGNGRRRVVACKAVIAEPPSSTTTKPGPIIMDGQVLHSITPERLALVSSLGDFVEKEVSPEAGGRQRCARAARPLARGRVTHARPPAPVAAGRAAAEGADEVLAADGLPAPL